MIIFSDSIHMAFMIRFKVDMDEIRRQYKRLYDHDLVKDIKNELNDEYEDIIVALVGKD